MEWDSEDTLNHTLYRQYTPAEGRWQTPDPSRGSVMSPQSLNLYSYAADNPVNDVDPFGLQSCPPMCVPVEQPDPGLPTCDCGPSGGGGGGGGCPNFARGAIRPDLMPVCGSPPSHGGGCSSLNFAGMLSQAERQVAQDLAKPACAADFKSPLAPAISSLANATFADLGPITPGKSQISECNMITGELEINSQVTWCNPQSFLIKFASKEVQASGAISSSELMDLALLHELEHLYGTIGNPDNPIVMQDLYKDCILGQAGGHKLSVCGVREGKRMSRRSIVTFTGVLLCLVGAQFRPACIGVDHCTPGYDVFGPYTVPLGGDIGETLTKERDFIWTHWHERRNGCAEVTTTSPWEGVRCTGTYIIEADRAGRWHVLNEWKCGPGIRGVPKATHGTNAWYSVQRVRRDDKGRTRSEPVPDSANAAPDSYLLLFKDMTGRNLSRL